MARILLIDDEHLRLLYAAELSEEGHKVIPLASGDVIFSQSILKTVTNWDAEFFYIETASLGGLLGSIYALAAVTKRVRGVIGVVLLGGYKEFERRVGVVTSTRGAKREMVIDAVSRLPQRFQYGDVARTCPGVSRPTINRALRQLREAGKIRCIKPGRDAIWEKTWSWAH